MQDKLQLLLQKLAGYDKLAIAFSGGVDSTFLLSCAKQVLGRGALAVTVTGPNFAPDEVAEAKAFCDEREIPHLLINLKDEITPVLEENPINRCYLCKKIVFQQIRNALDSLPIADGSNLDDISDYRPGRKATKELGIISPLEEVGFTKAEIRSALQAMNLPVWNKPAYACLATRIPFGQPATEEKMSAIYKVENQLRALGFPHVRLRHHGQIGRLEIPPSDFPRFCNQENMMVVNSIIKNAGFTYATLDLGGYTMGSLNPPKLFPTEPNKGD